MNADVPVQADSREVEAEDNPSVSVVEVVQGTRALAGEALATS